MSNTVKANSTGANKISTFVQAVIYITLALSVVAIVVAVGAYFETGSLEITLYLLAIGFISMGLAGYYAYQSRKHVANLKVEDMPILTTIECPKCNIKSTREFQRGDYVFKELEQCPKCDDKQLITAIYREVKQKEKPVKV
ncbi:MAG: zf-TFIIB domain-containing protein [Candidatus Bathyarchaeota archaeon]|nr:zf-TFIIB domain-containing protein [Candidatus Bathyarchaeota archaeon]